MHLPEKLHHIGLCQKQAPNNAILSTFQFLLAFMHMFFGFVSKPQCQMDLQSSIEAQQQNA